MKNYHNKLADVFSRPKFAYATDADHQSDDLTSSQARKITELFIKSQPLEAIDLTIAEHGIADEYVITAFCSHDIMEKMIDASLATALAEYDAFCVDFYRKLAV